MAHFLIWNDNGAGAFCSCGAWSYPAPPGYVWSEAERQLVAALLRIHRTEARKRDVPTQRQKWSRKKLGLRDK